MAAECENGHPLAEGDSACSQCGARIKMQWMKQSPRDRQLEVDARRSAGSSSPPSHRPESSTAPSASASIIRRVAAGIAVLAAISIWGGAAPADIEDVADQIETITSAAEEADSSSETVYQQQVVLAQENAELLKIIAIQNSDKRPMMMLFVGVLLLAVFAATSTTQRE